MKQAEFCSGTYLANRAADGLEYPEQAPLRWQSFDANGEPLCALPEDKPAPAPMNAWAGLAPLTFHDAALSIVRSQHKHRIMNTPTDKHQREQCITETVAQLAKEAVAERLIQIEQAAADTAEDAQDEDKDSAPVRAKLTLAISWPAGVQEPEIEVKATYSVRRVLNLSAKADGNLPLPFGAEEGEK